MTCPTQWCQAVLYGAIACFGAGWLVWVPLALLRAEAPRWSRVSAWVLFGAGSLLTVVGMEVACKPCGGY